MATVWPYAELCPRRVSVNFATRSLGGTPSLSGFQQVVASDAGAWIVTLGEIPLTTPAKVRRWREMDAAADGRRNAFLVPVYDLPRAPWDVDTFSDATAFSDSTGHRDATAASATVSGAAALRAVQIAINMATLDRPVAGQRFSIGERLYEIASIVSQVGSVATVRIRPPLRVALAGGEAVEFRRPVCKMRLAGDNEMHVDLDLNRFASASVSFVEDPY